MHAWLSSYPDRALNGMVVSKQLNRTCDEDIHFVTLAREDLRRCGSIGCDGQSALPLGSRSAAGSSIVVQVRSACNAVRASSTVEEEMDGDGSGIRQASSVAHALRMGVRQVLRMYFVPGSGWVPRDRHEKPHPFRARKALRTLLNASG